MRGGGTVPSKTMNVAGFYLLLLAFILTFIRNANFLAQTISEINMDKLCIDW